MGQPGLTLDIPIKKWTQKWNPNHLSGVFMEHWSAAWDIMNESFSCFFSSFSFRNVLIVKVQFSWGSTRFLFQIEFWHVLFPVIFYWVLSTLRKKANKGVLPKGPILPQTAKGLSKSSLYYLKVTLKTIFYNNHGFKYKLDISLINCIHSLNLSVSPYNT